MSKDQRKGNRARVDVRGPVFISYRQKDGTDVALSLAWLLRASGVPVWQDKTDLGPGDTKKRLKQALKSGLSGAVLVITQDIANSPVVREVELPRLLKLHRKRHFNLWIANTVRRDDGALDYGAPDALLRQPKDNLSGILQKDPLLEGERLAIAKSMLRARLAQVPSDGRSRLRLRIQTRTAPSAAEDRPQDIHVRLRPTDERVPSRDALLDLQSGLNVLHDSIQSINVSHLEVSGGAHLTVALALGMATIPGVVADASVAQGDAIWPGANVAAAASPRLLTSDRRRGDSEADSDVLAVYLDLLPTRNDAPFSNAVRALGSRVLASTHIRPAADGAPLRPAEAGLLAAEAAFLIRELQGTCPDAEVHLFLRVPFPIAYLLGRLLNTVAVVAYEWGDPEYVPALRLSGDPVRGVIEAVLITDPDEVTT